MRDAGGVRCVDCAERAARGLPPDPWHPESATQIVEARREPVLRTRMRVTVALIVLNVVVAAIATLSATTVSWTSPAAALFSGQPTPVHVWGALVSAPTRFSDIDVTVAGVAGGEWYRLLTSMFLHFGLAHLALNMLALLSVGRDLETVFGPVRFLVLYLVAGLTGSVAVLVFSGDTLTAGASGAIFGLFGALVPVLRRMRRSLVAIVPVILLNLAITFAVPGISIAGHLGGLACGLVLGTALSFAPRGRETRTLVLAVGGILVILAVAATARVLTLTM